MLSCEFNLNQPFYFHESGFFCGSDRNWFHLRRRMIDYELMVVTRGILYISENEKRYKVSTGEYLLMSPGSLQQGTHNSDCDFHWMHFTEAAESRKEEKPKSSVAKHGSLKNLDRISIMLKQLQDCARFYNDSTQNNYMCTCVICELLNQTNDRKNPSRQINKQIFNDIIDYISVSLCDEINVSEIAKKFGYNEKYVSHLFKVKTGYPLKQYILQKKMEHAKYLLSNTNFPIKLIAEQTGFSDEHHFMRAFKKEESMTASQFRNAFCHRLPIRYIDPETNCFDNMIIPRKKQA